MASFNPRKFADPDRLRSIAPARLAVLLNPWRPYFERRGFLFPGAAEAPIDYPLLSDILMRPDATTPAAMVDALYYVQETASVDDMDKLLAAIRSRGLVVDDDPGTTPIDLAIDVWCVAPDLVRGHHAESYAMRQKNFEYFGPRHPGRIPFPPVTEAQQGALEQVFDDWFERRRRGRGCRVFIIRHKPFSWILIRHGQPMRREMSHKDDGGGDIAFYRPQRHDVLIYDERSGDLGVHASTKGDRNLYLATLGGQLFGDEAYFPPTERFTLDPIVADGAASLQVEDVDGIEKVRLIEYRRYWGGVHRETETRKAEDIFAALATRGMATLTGGRLSSATFKITFNNAAKERSVTIRPPGIARYERNDDSELIDLWLRKRGFVVTASDTSDDEAPTTVLDGT